MSAHVEINEMDLVVLGQVQYDFSLDDLQHVPLADVLVRATGQRAVAVENEIAAVSQEARQRMRKVEDVGNALGYAAAIAAHLALTDEEYKTEATYSGDWLTALQKCVAPYDLIYTDENKKQHPISNLWEGNKVTYGDSQKLQSTLQLALDKENNALKQTNNTLESYISKRDSSYELIGKVQKKIDKTMSTAISAIGS